VHVLVARLRVRSFNFFLDFLSFPFRKERRKKLARLCCLLLLRKMETPVAATPAAEAPAAAPAAAAPAAAETPAAAPEAKKDWSDLAEEEGEAGISFCFPPSLSPTFCLFLLRLVEGRLFTLVVDLR
jgi:sugar phosphate isomerase/epimerase